MKTDKEQDAILRKIIASIAKKHGDGVIFAHVLPEFEGVELCALALGALWAEHQDPIKAALQLLIEGIDNKLIARAVIVMDQRMKDADEYERLQKN